MKPILAAPCGARRRPEDRTWRYRAGGTSGATPIGRAWRHPANPPTARSRRPRSRRTLPVWPSKPPMSASRRPRAPGGAGCAGRSGSSGCCGRRAARSSARAGCSARRARWRPRARPPIISWADRRGRDPAACARARRARRDVAGRRRHRRASRIRVRRRGGCVVRLVLLAAGRDRCADRGHGRHPVQPALLLREQLDEGQRRPERAHRDAASSSPSC